MLHRVVSRIPFSSYADFSRAAALWHDLCFCLSNSSCERRVKSTAQRPRAAWGKRMNVRLNKFSLSGVLFLILIMSSAVRLRAGQQAEPKRPNILVIMGDDVGWFNIGAYHQGMMSGKTPNLDKLAAQGMRFTDYYAE